MVVTHSNLFEAFNWFKQTIKQQVKARKSSLKVKGSF